MLNHHKHRDQRDHSCYFEKSMMVYVLFLSLLQMIQCCVSCIHDVHNGFLFHRHRKTWWSMWKEKGREWGAVRYSKLQKRNKEMWSCDRGHRTQHMQKMAILLDQQTETRCLAICVTTCKSHVLISPRHPIFAITSLTSFICFHLEWHVW